LATWAGDLPKLVIGLIKPGEPFGRRAYVACIANSAAKLAGHLAQ